MSSCQLEIIDLNSFQKSRKIGQGQDSLIYEIINYETQTQYAAKIPIKNISEYSKYKVNEISNEINIISKLNHPSILKYVGYSLIDFENNPRPVIITEYAENEAIPGFKNKALKSINWKSRRYIILYGIASAMSYLHSHNIIHCNLTLDNIRLDKSFNPKIFGFDFSRKVNENSKNKRINRFCKVVGTLKYIAPEIFSRREYSKSSDVYSFAFIILEIFSQTRMNGAFCLKYLSFMNKIVNEKTRPDVKKYSSVPQFYKELIEKCWSDDPNERPSFDEIVEILRNDPNLINDKEYQDYVKFIDNYQVTFDSTQKFNGILNFQIGKEKSKAVDLEIEEKLKNNVVNSNDEKLINNAAYSNDEKLRSNVADSEVEEKLINNAADSNDEKKIIINKVANSRNKVIDPKKFKLVSPIDENIFGLVSSFSNVDTNDIFLAQQFISLEEFCENDIIIFTQQISIISQINHPSIIKFIGYKLSGSTRKSPPMILYDNSHSKLSNFLKESNSFELWDDTQKLIVIYGIANAMSYLHSHNIIHRDLKPENIDLDDFLFPKINGFHLSKELQLNSDKEKMNKIQGTPAYLSPEIFMNKEYSKKSDVYAFSLLVYEILTNKKPFNELTTVNQIIEKVVKLKEMPEIDNEIPLSYRSLIEKCWLYEPNDRPTFDEIVDILKNDKGFITEKIDLEDYQKYIKLIDESDITFNSGDRISYDDITDLSLEHFRKNDIIRLLPISVLGIFETEINNISIDFNYIDINDYEKKDLIIDGNDVEIYKMIDKRTGIEYAGKEYIFDKYGYNLLSSYINISQELCIISKMKHPSINQFVGFSPGGKHPILITKFAVNGTLHDIVSLLGRMNEVPEWTDTRKLIIIYGIASGMAYLHSHNIIHRDLKPSNIILDEYLFPTINDFGLSRFIFDDIIENNVFNGTARYLAPEIIKGEKYGKPVDVYSFGLTVYNIVTGIVPFINIREPNKIMKLVSDGNRPELSSKIPKSYRDLITRCWSQEPTERPTFDEIVNILKTDIDFITDDIDKDDYYKFIKYIDESKTDLEYNSVYLYNESEPSSFEKENLFSYISDDIKLERVEIYAEEAFLFDYKKEKMIGSGSFGNVYEVMNKKTGNVYAAKVSKNYLTKCNSDDAKNLEREVNIISSLDHPAILKFIGFSINNFNGKYKPTIITELITNGSLDDIIKLERQCCGNLDWDDTKRLINIYGIASAMSYLHFKDILHRDLKPANILMDEFLFPKISDFGLSKNIYDQNDSGLNSGFKGTFAYCAPEIFDVEYTKAGDVYAFGIIVYEIMTNDIPYDGISPYQLMVQVHQGIRPEFKTEIPSCYRKLIESCWSTDPEKRPTFDEILDIIKNDPDFITENVDIDEFLNYVDMVDESQKKSNFDFYTPHFDFVYQNLNVKIFQLKKFKLLDIIDDRNDFEKVKIKSFLNDDFFIAKISKNTIDKMPISKKFEIAKEVDIISQLNHPCILKFIGYSPIDFEYNQSPVIITEITKFLTLKNVLNLNELNDTHKLIIIFGIAFGMKYLHSIGIIHRYLSSSAIFVDSEYHPKISDFDFSDNMSENCNENYFIENYFYSSPEAFKCQYAKSSDVYSFGMIVYEIMNKINSFEKLPKFNILIQILNGRRPEIRDDLPFCYRQLIEDCWSQDPAKRPTFDQIVDRLKTDSKFLTEKVDQNEFTKYIEYLEKCQEEIKTQITYHSINFSDRPKDSNNDEKSSQKVDQKDNQSEFNFRKVSVSYDDIKETTENEDEMKTKFLDLSHFELGKLINKLDYHKTYEVISKETEAVYLAKISTVKQSQLTKDELIELSREANHISQLHHPSFLKFIGFSPVDFKHKIRPVIITELSENGSLKDLLDIARQNIDIKGWDSTKKLINIYGIASGMSYLHSHEILHRDLSPTNIFLDSYYFPKIGDFGLSKRECKFDSLSYQSTSGLRGNPVYTSPEILRFNMYSKSGDVYSFGFVVFEIITGEVPFSGITNKNEIFNEIVLKSNRPNIPEKVPFAYRKLIESCWSQNADERPSFDGIVDVLEKEKGFITDDVRRNDFYKYIDFIKESKKSFDSNEKILEIEDFIRKKSKIKEKSNESDENETSIDVTQNINENSLTNNQKIAETNELQKVTENENKCSLESQQNEIEDLQKITENENSLTNNQKIAETNELQKVTENENKCSLESQQNEIEDLQKITENENSITNNEETKIISIQKVVENTNEFSLETQQESSFDSNKTNANEDIICSNMKITTETETVNKERSILNQPQQVEEEYNSSKLIEQQQKMQSEVIERLISSNEAVELIRYLHEQCTNEVTLSVLNFLSRQMPQLYSTVLNEGISLHNSVSHHMYGTQLLQTANQGQIEESKKHLEMSASLGFSLSFFVLARLHHEILHDDQSAFKYATEGAKSNECYSKCLLGHYIYRGIGIESNKIVGFHTMIESGADEKFIDSFSTEIGIGFYTESQEIEEEKSKKEEYKKKSFEYFKKAFDMNKTSATINNFAVCFILGNGVCKDVQKAIEILENEGIKRNDKNSKFVLGLLLSKSDSELSSRYIKDYALLDKKSKNEMIGFIDEDKISQREKICNEILAMKYSCENDTECTYLFMNKLISSGNFDVPIEYAINLYKQKKFVQSFYYMNLMMKFGHPIAKFFVGVMKFNGEGCEINREESYSIMKNLSKAGIVRATEFIDDNF